MASVASQLTEEVTAHLQNDSLEDAREICADGSYFPNNLRIYLQKTAGTCNILAKSCDGISAPPSVSLYVYLA